MLSRDKHSANVSQSVIWLIASILWSSTSCPLYIECSEPNDRYNDKEKDTGGDANDAGNHCRLAVGPCGGDVARIGGRTGHHRKDDGHDA